MTEELKRKARETIIAAARAHRDLTAAEGIANATTSAVIDGAILVVTASGTDALSLASLLSALGAEIECNCEPPWRPEGEGAPA